MRERQNQPFQLSFNASPRVDFLLVLRRIDLLGSEGPWVHQGVIL